MNHDQRISAHAEKILRIGLQDSLDLLRGMMAINSFSTNRAGVQKLAAFTAEAFAPLGFSAEFVPSQSPQFGPHLLMTANPSPDRPVIGLISHLDTVFSPEEERAHDFVYRVSGDKLYGPGAVDIKGGTVMIHAVLRAVRETLPELWNSITWQVLCNASEEVLGLDFGELVLQALPQKRTLAALVFELGRMEGEEFLLVTQRKGRAAFEAHIEGRGAHAGSAHHMGANAIQELAEVILKLQAMTDYAQDVTVNVGLAAGGTVVNRVPHSASLQGEMRAHDPLVFDKVLGQIRSLEQAGAVRSRDGVPCRITMQIKETTAPWGDNPGTGMVLRAWQEAGEQLGWRVKPEHRGGLSDANLIWRALPTLDGLGPDGGNCHCSVQAGDGSAEQEYLRISSFVPKAVLNVMGVRALAAGAY